jgi:exodeoxyribonuclease VII large subunit
VNPELVFSPTDFVAITNQVFEQAYAGSVVIEGELSDFKISQNRWVYFNLKDDLSSIKFFGTVYMLPGPLEDGMVLKVSGSPRLHPKFGFSVNIQNIALSGEGTIKKAFDLLKAKLTVEGLFDEARKRSLPYPPQKIGLITSEKSAAYADFVKVIGQRFGGLEILLADVQVQGEAAVSQIVAAIKEFNDYYADVDVLVLTRGGGSLDDLAVFSTEPVTRAVAASRIPTLVAVGHEVDLSLAELAADVRASTPSNAAEILVPDKLAELGRISQNKARLNTAITQVISDKRKYILQIQKDLQSVVSKVFIDAKQQLSEYRRLLGALGPASVLSRGYAIVRQDGRAVGSANQVKLSHNMQIELRGGQVVAKPLQIESK